MTRHERTGGGGTSKKYFLCYIHEKGKTRWWIGRDVLGGEGPMRAGEMQVYGPLDTPEDASDAQGLIPVWTEEDEERSEWG